MRLPRHEPPYLALKSLVLSSKSMVRAKKRGWYSQLINHSQKETDQKLHIFRHKSAIFRKQVFGHIEAQIGSN